MIAGNSTNFYCVVSGDPAPTISWTKGGFSINQSNNSRISFSENKELLTITNLNRQDSGEYQCVANNSLGTGSSNVATLNVLCK